MKKEIQIIGVIIFFVTFIIGTSIAYFNYGPVKELDNMVVRCIISFVLSVDTGLFFILFFGLILWMLDTLSGKMDKLSRRVATKAARKKGAIIAQGQVLELLKAPFIIRLKFALRVLRGR
jgi:hypothetical protein